MCRGSRSRPGLSGWNWQKSYYRALSASRYSLMPKILEQWSKRRDSGLRPRVPGIPLRIFGMHHPREFPATFAAIKSYRPSALIVSTNTLTILHLDEIVRFASSNQLPTFSEAAEFAEAGFLLTYGPDVSNTYRRGALQVDRILKGTNLNDLPFEKPTKFELVINMKTAKALGLIIPKAIILRATRVLR